MKTKLSILALALCSTSALADSWLYAGGQIGQSDIEGESDIPVQLEDTGFNI